MKIMVFDVPADSGGALTILNLYYSNAIKDRENEWIFVVSTAVLKQTMNITVLNYPWIKRSWFHRLFFDTFIANTLVKRYGVNKIISLQNVVIPRVKIKQTLYLHQPLPFVEKRYRITEHFKFWLYQNIISRRIIKSLQVADKVIVQTKWMRESAIEKAKIDENKFLLEQPKLNIQVKQMYSDNKNKDNTFFYPASALIYKNHQVIVSACKLLKDNGIENYKVVFTLKGNENKHIKKLRNIAIKEKLPIDFIGSIDISTVYGFYQKSILIFSSYIETFGLPLLEAKMHGSPIIASNCAFALEILENYDKVDFFNPHSNEELFKIMISKISI